MDKQPNPGQTHFTQSIAIADWDVETVLLRITLEAAFERLGLAPAVTAIGRAIVGLSLE
ncbi:hypothetical protein D3C85_1658700 [compost metagenome]